MLEELELAVNHGFQMANPYCSCELTRVRSTSGGGRGRWSGWVGAGKSSLLAAILSEMEQQGSGAVEVIGGPVAYVPQQSWIISGTIRENVLFGRPIDLARYAAVLTACQLDADLAVMAPTGGDETEIGERVKRPAIRHESLDSFLCGLGSCRQPEFVGSFQGLNLSGGQGLRLSLARAAYQATDPAGGCELVLLDDPLSTRWLAGVSPGTQI